MVDASGGASGFFIVRGIVFLWRLILDVGRSIKRSFVRKPVGYFWPPEYYFDRYLGERGQNSSITHEIKCVGRDKELDDILASIDSGSISIVHITAPPGHGKSRVVLELARLLRGLGRGFFWYIGRWFSRCRWKTYFVRPDARNILDHVDELRKNRKVALFVDNAHEMPRIVHELATYSGLPSDEGRILLICVSRSTLSNLVIDALADVPVEELRTLRLKKLDRDEIGQIVDSLLPNQPSDAKKRVVAFAQDSAFLAVFICQLIKRDANFSEAVSDDSFRRKICDFPIEQAVIPCNISTNNAILATAVLAAASPVDHTAESIRTAVCKLAALTKVDYNCLIAQLIESGLFSTYAKSVLRPTPDLVGALLIDTACLDKGRANSFSGDLLNQLFPNHSLQALNNLSDLGWTVGLADSVDVVGPIIDAETKKIDADQPWACRQVIEILEPLALRRAPHVIEYVDAVWAVTKKSLRSDAAQAKDWTQVIGVAVPLLGVAAHDDSVSEQALNLIKEIAIWSGAETIYDNHKPQTVLSDLIGFSTSRSVKKTSRLLTVIESWCKLGGSGAVIALRSIGGLLSTTVQWTESDAFTVSWKTSLINLSDQVKDVRRRALDMVVQGVQSSDASIQGEAFEAASSIGESRGSPVAAVNAAMDSLVEQEKIEILDVLCELLDGPRDNLRNVRVERLVWDWWRRSSDQIAEKCEKVLTKIQDDEKYRVFKYIYTSQQPVCPISDILTKETDLSRSDRFFSEKRDEWENSRSSLANLVNTLGLADEPEEWINLFGQLEKKELEISWRSGPVFDAVAEHYPNTGWALLAITDGSLPSKFKASLLYGCRLADRNRWESELSSFIETDPVDVDLALAWQSSVDWRAKLTELEWALVDKCISTEDQWLRKRITSNLAHGSEEDWLARCQKLLCIARDNPTEVDVIDDLFVTLSHGRPADQRSELIDVDLEALHFLLSDGVHEDVPWDKPHWVGSFLELVARLDEERFLDFVESSFSKDDGIKRMHIRILGARNATKAFNKLLESGYNRTHVARFFGWAVQDNILGEFAGSLISSALSLNDTSVAVQLESLYASKSFKDVARILQYFKVDQEWLQEVDRLMVEVDRHAPDEFDEVATLFSNSYWAGMTSRTPGYPGPRDKLVADYFNQRLNDQHLRPRVRQYFRERAEAAEASIERDLAEDERLAGRAL